MAARRYYYSDSITDFLSRNTNEIVGKLTQASQHDIYQWSMLPYQVARKGGTAKREMAPCRCGGNREIAACMVGNYENFAVCCLGKNMTLETGLCTLIGTKLRTKPYPKVQITKFKVQKVAKNYPQSAKIALWKKSLYSA